MALTTAGINFIAHAVAGQSTPFDTANARIGVGNGTDAFAANQIDLTGNSTFRKSVDRNYPIVNAPSILYKATFESNEANFAWNEWGLFNAETGGVMLNRVVESNGIKQEGETWLFEVVISFAIGT